MKISISSPTRTAMQSGQGKTGEWVITFPPALTPAIDPLMGWMGMAETTQQLKLSFANKEEAVEYANKNGLEYDIIEPKHRIIKPKSYAANFAFKRENRA
jgi:ETC complex I subunit conserved region